MSGFAPVLNVLATIMVGFSLMFLVPLGYLLFIGLPLNLQGTSWWNGVKGRYFNRKSA